MLYIKLCIKKRANEQIYIVKLLYRMNFLEKYSMDTFIIAEIGVNHNGDINLAKQLINIAKESGADAVKFQTFNTEKVIKINAPKAQYQKTSDNDDVSQFDMVKKLELTKRDFLELKKYVEDKNIMFISTPFDTESVDILDEIGVDFFKIGSGDCDNFILLKKIMNTKKPIIISTGMCDINEVEQINNFLINNNYENNYIFLHCISSYPAPPNEMNLLCSKRMNEKFNVHVGFSDHTTNDIAAIMAIGYGAKCIEKHITLDNNLSGPDHKASMNPVDFKNFVSSLRLAEKMIGDDGILSELGLIPLTSDVRSKARNKVLNSEKLTIEELKH